MIKRVSLSHIKSTLVRRRSLSKDRTLGNTEVSHSNNNQRLESVSDSQSPRGKTNLLKMLRRWKKKKKGNLEVVATFTQETVQESDSAVPFSRKIRSKSQPVSPFVKTRQNAIPPTQETNQCSSQIKIPSSQQVVSVMVVTSDNEPSGKCVDVTLDHPHHHCHGNFTRELFKLSRCGWYWGPISRKEAEEKLLEQGDGAFLVRDSSDDHYLLSLSFRSYGQILHTRIEHCNGLFSFYSEPEPEGHSSIVQLIENSMSYSQSGVFCYSQGRTPNSPSYPVRLTKPVSRFNQVRTLQYLCRFVIRQYTRFDHIQKLPLPAPIKGYLQEAHY